VKPLGKKKKKESKGPSCPYAGTNLRSKQAGNGQMKRKKKEGKTGEKD